MSTKNSAYTAKTLLVEANLLLQYYKMIYIRLVPKSFQTKNFLDYGIQIKIKTLKTLAINPSLRVP